MHITGNTVNIMILFTKFIGDRREFASRMRASSKVVDANSRQSRFLNVFFVLSASLQRPRSGLWLAADRRYSVMASGHAVSNQVGGTKDLLACGSMVMAIDPGVYSRLLPLNQQALGL